METSHRRKSHIERTHTEGSQNRSIQAVVNTDAIPVINFSSHYYHDYSVFPNTGLSF